MTPRNGKIFRIEMEDQNSTLDESISSLDKLLRDFQIVKKELTDF